MTWFLVVLLGWLWHALVFAQGLPFPGPGVKGYAGAGSTVAVDARATLDATADAVTTLDMTTLTVGSGANRALVCQVSNNGDPGTQTVNWDATGTPQALTQIVTANNGTGIYARLYGRVAPTAGNKTLRVTNTTARDTCVFCIAFTGVDQTGGVTSFPNSTSSSNTTANPSLTITSAAGAWTISVLTTTTSVPSAPNHTSDYIEQNIANINSAGQDATGAATVTHSWTATADTWVEAGTSVKAAP